jgi:lipoprotein-anchoring transpeptidase ErfK/SrfK
VRTIRVGTGAAATPTPTGRFAVTDKLDGAAYSPVYGCCILAISAHQTHLPSGWTGGDRIAIHGGPTAGAVSTGCLHADTSDLRYLMRVVPLGALVVIHP